MGDVGTTETRPFSLMGTWLKRKRCRKVPGAPSARHDEGASLSHSESLGGPGKIDQVGEMIINRRCWIRDSIYAEMMCPPSLVFPPADIGLWTEDELFKSSRKIIDGSPLPGNVITDVNPYQYKPSHLPGQSQMGSRAKCGSDEEVSILTHPQVKEGTKKSNRPVISLSKCEISLAKRGERDVIGDRKVEQIDGDSSFSATAPGGKVAEVVVGESLKNDVRAYQTLRAILTLLEQAYCGSIGYEYMSIADREKCNWLREKIETPTPMQYNRQRREVILERLMWSTQFENFLATKWTAAKRFGLDGCETLIPGMKEMFDRSADLGVETIVIGMSHRGRLNVLGNVVRKPLRQIFSEFAQSLWMKLGYTQEHATMKEAEKTHVTRRNQEASNSSFQ
ncbi:hypothetical protein RJ639_044491 [Escallonia herrerae]|uniref:Uncharacterized protein n=1 Tax=Escallonia herrerae TaxID=1293975 RepID=A0AA89B886_9ASTE|nr:hypothetical protein RJ639_044491 [Escallonia herrerae]